MIFYNETTKQGICQKIDFLCDTTDTSYPRVDKTREVNEAGKNLIAELINADGTWQYDDTNYTDLPIGTGDLVVAQSVYSFTSEYLQILAVKVKDNDGYWHILKPIDQREINYPLEDLLETDGLPSHYDKLGDTIRLYPAPAAANVTLADGIKVEFKRNFKIFTVASGVTEDTTEPGLDIEHDILAYMAAIPYCMIYKKDRVLNFERIIEQKKYNLRKHYSSREKDIKTIMKTKQRCYK